MKINSYRAIAAFLIGAALIFPPVIPAAEKDMMKDEKALKEKGRIKEGNDPMMKEKMNEKAGKTAPEGKMTKDEKMKMDDKTKMDEKK